MNRPESTIIDQILMSSQLDVERQKIHKIVNNSLKKFTYFNETSMDKEMNLSEIINDERDFRLCYMISYFYTLNDNSFQIAQGICDIDINHSWCEKGDIVYDPNWDNIITDKKNFYRKNNIYPGNVFYYSALEATQEIIKHNGFGHWDGIINKNNTNKAHISECFSNLYDNINQVEKFSWIVDGQDNWFFKLKLNGEEEKLYYPRPNPRQSSGY